MVKTETVISGFVYALFIVLIFMMITAIRGNMADDTQQKENDRIYRLCIIKAHETKQEWEYSDGKCYLKADL